MVKLFILTVLVPSLLVLSETDEKKDTVITKPFPGAAACKENVVKLNVCLAKGYVTEMKCDNKERPFIGWRDKKKCTKVEAETKQLDCEQCKEEIDTDENCIFGKIIRREVPVNIIYEDHWCVAFDDANPQAPVHFLVIPKKHIKTIGDAGEEDTAILGNLLQAVRKIAVLKGIANNYRVVINSGEKVHVPHMHIHVIGGRDFTWPPG